MPDNVVRAAADNDILAVMFFALMIGVGLVLTQSAERPTRLQATSIEGLFEVVDDA